MGSPSSGAPAGDRGGHPPPPALFALLSPLGGVAQRGPGVGRVLMDACRVVALSGVMVATTTVGPGKAYALTSSEDGMAKDCGDGF